MTRRRRTRRNPTGTILVNPGKSRRARRAGSGRSKKSVSLAGLFSKLNPGRGKRRGSTKRRSMRRSSRANPRVKINRSHRRRTSHRRAHRRSSRRMTRANPGKRTRRHGRRRAGTRRNPVIINRGKRRGGSRRIRRNPGPDFGLKALLRKVQAMISKVPIVGPVIASAIGGVGSAAAGALAVVPAELVLPRVSRWIPRWAQPYAYSAVSLLLSAGVKLLPRFPYQSELAMALPFSGGAVDWFRHRHGVSGALSGVDEYGDPDLGDLGDLGNDGSPLAAVEFAGCDLADADYAGDDFTEDELSAIEMGRAAFRKRFYGRKAAHVERGPGRASEYASQPGNQWGWLIYVIGFDGVQKLASYPEHVRRQWILDFKKEAKLLARKMLSQGMDTDVSTAETAGLLVAA